ncbi:MAG: hypothetical protein WC509_08950 [Candidatus Izemoplasmatales bacterium]
MDVKRMLFALRIKWETVRKEFGFKAILDALFAGFVYALLCVFPLVAVLTELLLLSMHRVYTFTVFYILAALGFVWLWHRLAFLTLKLKRPDHESDARGVLRLLSRVWMALVLVAGLLFLIVFIPAMTA